MNQRLLIAVACVIPLILGIITWLNASQSLIPRRMPETPPVKGLQNGLTLQDFPKWQKAGTGAVPVLVEAMGKRPGPLAKAYSNTWSRMPAQIQSNLPAPADDAKIRMAAGALLAVSHIGTNIPLPALARALQDQSWPVRMNALACLGNVVLPRAGMEKAEIRPQILTATADSQMEVRMSAVYCLRFYKDAPDQVIPVLTKSLADNYPDVRIRAVLAFHEVDPVAAEKAGALSVASRCLQSDGSHGSRIFAMQFLQKQGKLPPIEAK